MITKFIEPWILYPGLLILILFIAGMRLVLTGLRIRGSSSSSAEHLIMSVGRGWSKSDGARGEGRPSALVRRTGLLFIVLAFFLYFASTEVGARRTLGVVERSISPGVTLDGPASAEDPTTPSSLRADAIVVLGGGTVTDSPNESGRAALTADSNARLTFAVRLAQRYSDLPIVVTGGRVFDEPEVPPESTVAARLLREYGIAADRIIQERESRTTWENAAFTREIADLRYPIVVTSAYHMPRALMAFRANGMEPVPAPCDYKLDQRPLRAYMYLPSNHMLHNTGVWWRELIGRAWYRVLVWRAGRDQGE